MLTEQVVAGRIKEIRIKKNYSQYYVAYKLNISQNSFSKIELGNVKLTLARLIEIAKVLEISVSELVRCDEESHHNHQLPIVSKSCNC
ncbi:helix-turn-helix domain-containing protein [Mucilaginibacter endophyticus]|jgi:transcriptional regulator with XRE-family HTH domain|uniref:helix-turn-helix domain-containing protein n=1 Tax=Mucilaginibacter endophyticus TaxID=2675003 RepID=UPI000E0D6432|nr:helix-turn-helix transcriptional regulator [Mucilaginibacter endophyticus]